MVLQDPGPCTLAASARSWTVHGGGQFRILDRALWRQVQDPGPCTVEASARSWTVHGEGQLRILDHALRHAEQGRK